MNRDFAEMLAGFFAAGVEFLVVGAHALAFHGSPRATGDLDLWVNPTPENAKRVWGALVEFGAPLDELTLADLSTPDIVFQIGRPPSRIDILTSISGVRFDNAWRHRVSTSIDGHSVPFLSRDDLITNKRCVARPKDLADVDALEAVTTTRRRP